MVERGAVGSLDQFREFRQAVWVCIHILRLEIFRKIRSLILSFVYDRILSAELHVSHAFQFVQERRVCQGHADQVRVRLIVHALHVHVQNERVFYIQQRLHVPLYLNWYVADQFIRDDHQFSNELPELLHCAQCIVVRSDAGEFQLPSTLAHVLVKN